MLSNFYKSLFKVTGVANGASTLVTSLPVQESKELTGMARCAAAVTLTIFQGYLKEDGVTEVYDVKDTVTVPADNTEGAGVKIGPINVVGSLVKITASASGAQSTFHMYLQGRT